MKVSAQCGLSPPSAYEMMSHRKWVRAHHCIRLAMQYI
jgi:hypothetical protein